MQVLILASLFVAAAHAQFFPGFPFLGYGGLPTDDQYAASLGGAPVGIYDRKHYAGGPFGGGLSSDVSGASLGGAKVGIYGKERPQGVGQPILPFASPVLFPQRIGRPIRQVRPVYRVPPPRYY